MRNSTLLTIASASAVTAAAVPVQIPNDNTTEAANPSPQNTEVPGYNSKVWHAHTTQSGVAQPFEAVVVETYNKYEHLLEQARKDATQTKETRGLRDMWCDKERQKAGECNCVVM